MLLMALALSVPSALADNLQGEALWSRLQEHLTTDGALLPAAQDVHGPACMTGLVRDLRAGLSSLSPEQQAQVLTAIEPWRQRWQEGAAPPPEPCVGHYGTSWVEGEHFSVEWDDSTISEATAQSFLDSLEYSWDVEVNDLDWIGPSGATSRPILVYVQSGGYAGAYTSVLECSSGNYSAMPYIVAYAGSFSAGDWYKTMAAHEFNHASQFYYGYAHEFYWWEATATWMEEYVYPSLNDWADPIYAGYSRQPHIAFNASDQQDQDIFWHMYAMAVWAKYLDEYVGGPELIRSLWEAASDYPSTYYGLWMPDAIEDVGYSFDEIYPEFMAVAAFMDFSEVNYYLQPDVADTVSSLPAEGEGDRELPQSLGQNFIHLESGVFVEGATLQITFDGADEADGWYVVLARGEGRALDTHVTASLNEGYTGTAEIEMVEGAEYFLIVSPVDQSAAGGNYNWSRVEEFGYTWSAAAVLPESPDNNEGSGVDGEGSGEGKAGLCGYTHGTGAGLLWLAPLIVVARRRSSR